VSRAPANILLRRAQLVLMLAGLVPTIALSATGIILIVLGSGGWLGVVIGILVLAFCTSAVTGYILGSVFLTKGASVARFQNDYLSAVSHELNTPLTSIRMFIETLRNENRLDAAEKEKCLDLLDREIGRLDGLVSELFELSRMETGRYAFARDRVVVADLVDDALTAFAAATMSNPTEIEVDLEDGLAIEGDHAALTQALTNLLTNAWKYTGDDKKIRLTGRFDGKRIELAVHDNGRGIPRLEQRTIFEQFERGKSAIDEGAEGAGLGLAIVRAIVRGHRGKLDLESTPGEGTSFYMNLRPYQES
jgi:two-component system phosphate regulon sensor histidine kinase PhoR